MSFGTFLVFWAFRDFEVKIRFSYSSLDFEDFLFFFVLFFFSLRCNRTTLTYASVTEENEGVTI